MKKVALVGLLALVSLATVMFTAKEASAETLTFYVVSEHPNTVDLEFYSEDREHAWPGGGEVYIIDDNETHDYLLSCQPNEKICLGAWVRGDESQYWGVGRDAGQSCSSCCFYCDGGYTETQVLNY